MTTRQLHHRLGHDRLGERIENLRGSRYADSLTGDTTANVLEGGADADQLFGGGGNESALAGSFGDISISELNGGVNTLITFDGARAGNKIILHDVVASSLSAADSGFLI